MKGDGIQVAALISPWITFIQLSLRHFCVSAAIWNTPRMFLCRKLLIKSTASSPSRKLHICGIRKATGTSGVLVDQAVETVQPAVSAVDKGRLGSSSHPQLPPSIRAATPTEVLEYHLPGTGWPEHLSSYYGRRDHKHRQSLEATDPSPEGSNRAQTGSSWALKLGWPC